MSGFCCGCCSSDEDVVTEYPMPKPVIPSYDDPYRFGIRPPYGSPYPPTAPPGGPRYPPTHYTTPTGTYPTGYTRPTGIYPPIPPICVCPTPPPNHPLYRPPSQHHYPPRQRPPYGGNWSGNHKNSVVWVQTVAGGHFPSTAVRGGRDLDGSEIFVGRAYHDGDLIPAKVIPGRHIAYVAHGGREIEKHEFEVLCQGTLSWQFANSGGIPDGAVPVGHTSSGETLYAGRVLHEGTQTVGKVHPSHGTCYIPYNGEEISYNDYEVLVLHHN